MRPAERNGEHERIRAVYAYYETSDARQRKRDSSNLGNQLIRASQWAALQQAITRLDMRVGATILDVGCGRGEDLQHIAGEFGHLRPSLHGVDLLPSRIEQARSLLPQATLRVADGERLEYQDRFFDLVLAARSSARSWTPASLATSHLRWLGSSVTTGSSCVMTCATRIRGIRIPGPFAAEICVIFSPRRAYGSHPSPCCRRSPAASVISPRGSIVRCT